MNSEKEIHNDLNPKVFRNFLLLEWTFFWMAYSTWCDKGELGKKEEKLAFGVNLIAVLCQGTMHFDTDPKPKNPFWDSINRWRSKFWIF